MNGYVCHYKDKRIEIKADNSYAAQLAAQKEFQKLFPRKKVKGYEISIVLCERNGEQVIHKPLF